MAKITANNIQSGAITLDKLDSSVAGNLAAANNASAIATIATSIAVAAFEAANTNAAILAGAANPPLITTIQIADSSYNVLDDTAANTTGGFVVITGSGFTSNSTVIIGSTVAPLVTFVSSTTLRVQTPALTAASYPVYVVNSDGNTAIKPNGLTTSSFPIWSTGATLSDWPRNWPTAVNLNATSDSNLIYANTSVLPPGTTLAANGLFSGTVSPAANTIYTFDVRVTDAELQDAIRTFTVSALTLDVRRLWIAGFNSDGQLGLNNRDSTSSPVQLGTEISWLNSSASTNFTLATKQNGTLWAWGSNANGQLGQNDRASRSSPVQIGTDTNWLKATATSYGTIAVKTNGTLWAWGDNTNGQLGHNNRVNTSSPIQVGALTNWTSRIAGGNSVVAIKSDGTMWTWGRNQNGQLALGNRIDRSSPSQVGNGSTWRNAAMTIVVGEAVLIATTTSNALWTCGSTGQGQLGVNTNTVYRSSPVQVSGATWNSVAAARGVMAATRTNGTLWTWGAGSFGGLGTSSTIYKSSPTQVGALTNWNIISGAFPGILAIKTDGTLWRWGNNGQGQLATNDTAYRSSPVQIGTNTNWSSSDNSFYLHWAAVTLY